MLIVRVSLHLNGDLEKLKDDEKTSSNSIGPIHSLMHLLLNQVDVFFN